MTVSWSPAPGTGMLRQRWRELVLGEYRPWWGHFTLAALSLASIPYGIAGEFHRWLHFAGILHTAFVPCPVISVGNLTVGGTGKTTTVRWLAGRLRDWGYEPAVVSRGYGAAAGKGMGSGVVVSDPRAGGWPATIADAATVGDEPRMLALALPGVPVLAGKQRALVAARACREFRPDAVILDDAFQHWPLRRNLDLVLLSCVEGLGNARLFPRGTLRELPRALRRAHAVLLTHADEADAAAREALRQAVLRENSELVVAEARHEPAGPAAINAAAEPLAGISLRGCWVALSSIGNPAAFEHSVRAAGAERVIPVRFADHHAYRRAEVLAVCHQAERCGAAGIVTTEKDSVKIPRDWLGEIPALVLPVRLRFLSGEDALEALLRSVLPGR